MIRAARIIIQSSCQRYLGWRGLRNIHKDFKTKDSGCLILRLTVAKYGVGCGIQNWAQLEKQKKNGSIAAQTTGCQRLEAPRCSEGPRISETLYYVQTDICFSLFSEKRESVQLHFKASTRLEITGWEIKYGRLENDEFGENNWKWKSRCTESSVSAA